MKQQHQNSEDAGKWEPSGLPKSICWHDTLLPLVGNGIGGPTNFVPIRMQLTCNPTMSARHYLAEPSMLFHGQSWLLKTVVLTNEAQPPSHLWTQTGIKLQVKNGSGGHKWLGCILGVGKAGRTTLDLTHHLQAASKAFFANKNILCDQNVPVKDRRRYFDAVVSPVALFGCGHRTVHQKDLHQLDVACGKFLRAVVGPPSNIDWSRPWHEILHDWPSPPPPAASQPAPEEQWLGLGPVSLHIRSRRYINGTCLEAAQ